MPLGVGCSQKAEAREANVDLRSWGHVGTAVMPRVGLHPREGVGIPGSGLCSHAELGREGGN